MRPRAALAISFLALIAAGPIRCGDDPTPRLEAEKAAFLARTVPKAEFWSTVQRKGELVLQEKSTLEEGETTTAKAAVLAQEINAAEAELTTARDERRQAEAVLEQAHSQLAHANAERETRAARLRAFAERQAAGAGS